VLAATACVLLVALLSLALIKSQSRSAAPANTLLPPSGHLTAASQLNFDFAVDPAADYVIADESISPLQQQAELIAKPMTKTSTAAGAIQVWASGQIKPDQESRLFPTGEQLTPVTVNGLAAWTDDHLIAWRWSPGRWADVALVGPGGPITLPGPDGPTKLSKTPAPAPTAAERRATLIEMADAVRFPSPGQPLRLPFRLGYLPNDMNLSAPAWTIAQPANANSSMRKAWATISLTDAADPHRQLTVTVTGSPSSSKDFCPDQKGIVVTRFSWESGRGCWETSPSSGTSGNMSLRLANGTEVDVYPVWHGVAEFNRAELQQIAETITVVSDLNDTSTWYAAQQ
jgi:hypothetical protein